MLRTLGTNPWFEGRLLVSRAQTVFNKDGTLRDEAIQKQLEQFLNGLVEFIQKSTALRNLTSTSAQV